MVRHIYTTTPTSNLFNYEDPLKMSQWFLSWPQFPMLVVKNKVYQDQFLHATFDTGAMIAEGAAENSIKLVHPLLRRRLRPGLPLTHCSNPFSNVKSFKTKAKKLIEIRAACVKNYNNEIQQTKNAPSPNNSNMKFSTTMEYLTRTHCVKRVHNTRFLYRLRFQKRKKWE